MENRYTQDELKLLAQMAPVSTYPNEIADIMAVHEVEVPWYDIPFFYFGSLTLMYKNCIYELKQEYRVSHGHGSLLDIPYEDLPLHINDISSYNTVETIIKWRLKIGK